MSFKRYTIAALFVLGSTVPALSVAADVEAGEARAAVCAACHGKNGIAQIPGYPNLAGQNEQYLVSALKAYKNKQRSGGNATIMQSQATGLSEEDIANLAAFYASLPAGGK
ncbi:cytochrome c [Marinobacter sp. CHS3-4]|uniref:c-type cytochrome n=1 Tax=Marinobacter sp. CHS3-4 TaxID=3045174 RepID=UPI0024B4C303|nr:cytochrome c [Marinobacter sp. CHS3-4]MDI9244044.1 cytochrome c [Marinobacter sp. CHS3-4]